MDDLVARFGSAKRPDRPVARRRPDGMDDATAAALGKLSKALETVEAARGLLYQFHRMTGTADLELQDAVDELRRAGHDRTAAEIDEVLIGRDLVGESWTFQLVENYDEQYWSTFRLVVDAVFEQFRSPRHVFEAEMKRREQSESSLPPATTS
jgi:hypothetical protein